MDAGLAGHVSGEFLRTLLTAVPIFVGVVVLLSWQSARWRKLLWLRCDLQSIEAQDGVDVTPRWCGWTLKTSGVRVDIAGGLAGCQWRSVGRPWSNLTEGQGGWRALCAAAAGGDGQRSD